MKKSFTRILGTLTLTAILCLGTTAGAQMQNVPPKQGPGIPNNSSEAVNMQARQQATGALEFAATEKDFGTVSEGEIVDIAFPFKNTSDQEIKILKVRTSCGCTAAKDNPEVVKPGEETEIRVQFNSRGRSGPQHKSVFVQTDEEGVSEYRLDFEGQSIRELYTSERILSFNRVDSDQDHTQAFSLFNLSGNELGEVKVINSDDRIKVDLKEKKATNQGGREGTEYVYNVTIPAGTAPGLVTADIGFENPALSSLRVGVRGQVLGEIEAVPQRLFLGVVPPGKSKQHRLVIRNRKGGTLEILETKAEKIPGLEFTVEEGNNSSEKVLVALFEAGEDIGAKRGDITVKTKYGEKEQELEIPFSVVVRDLNRGYQSNEARSGGFVPMRGAQRSDDNE